jgi:sarcosine oxidase gamma subunit
VQARRGRRHALGQRQQLGLAWVVTRAHPQGQVVLERGEQRTQLGEQIGVEHEGLRAGAWPAV